MRKQKYNPMESKGGIVLLILCFPLWFVIWGHYELKNDREKRRRKRHEKAVRHWDSWWNI